MLRLKSEEFAGHGEYIKVLNRAPQSDYPEHCHDFSEIVLVSSGSGTHIVNGTQKVVLPNTLMCVSDNDYHQYVDNHSVMLINIIYNKHLLNLSSRAVSTIKRLEKESVNLLITEEMFAPIFSLAVNMRAEQEQSHKHSEAMILLMFEQFLLFIDRIDINSVNNSPLMSAIAYLCNNYKDQNLSVNQICDSFQITSRALGNKIYQLTGLPTNKFLNQLRIRKSINLIDKGLPITDIAYHVGYNDSNYFSTKFKAVTGKSPREYKKSLL